MGKIINQPALKFRLLYTVISIKLIDKIVMFCA